MRRRKTGPDPLADVPEYLRAFDPAWLEVAAQGPDGYDEALAAAERWRAERNAWEQVHGHRGTALAWMHAQAGVRRRLWVASEVWRPADGWTGTRHPSARPAR